MTRISKWIAVVALTLFGLNGSALASSIFLVGDSNIFTTRDDNEKLFQNIFNGKNVLNDARDSIAGLGTTANETIGTITDANLAGQDFLITGFNNTTYTAAEQTSILNFVNGGGSLFMVGEGNSAFSTTNSSLNGILGRVGSSMRIDLDSNLVGASLTSLEMVTNNTPFGAGINAWTSGFASTLLLGLNGQAVVSGKDGNNPPSCGASNVLCDGIGEVGVAVAYENLSAVPVPAAAWLFASAMIGLAGFGRRKKATL